MAPTAITPATPATITGVLSFLTDDEEEDMID